MHTYIIYIIIKYIYYKIKKIERAIFLNIIFLLVTLTSTAIANIVP